MINYATLVDARAAVAEWNGQPDTVEHIANSGSAVFRFRNSQERRQILRLTDATFRSRQEVEAELHFLAHLRANAVSVAYGIPNREGSLTAAMTTGTGSFVCSALSFADGVRVDPNGLDWNGRFFRAWGRNLASIHNAAQMYRPPADAPRLWMWSDEILFRRADQLLPRDDSASRQEYAEVLDLCREIERSSATFGVIHADHAPQNFHYSRVANQITAFDFGNSCYHWFVADIAISLSTIRRRGDREEIRAEILRGYADVRGVPSEYERLIDIFLRLRAIYVYLDRLYLFGSGADRKQRDALKQLQAQVHAKAGW